MPILAAGGSLAEESEFRAVNPNDEPVADDPAPGQDQNIPNRSSASKTAGMASQDGGAGTGATATANSLLTGWTTITTTSIMTLPGTTIITTDNAGLPITITMERQEQPVTRTLTVQTTPSAAPEVGQNPDNTSASRGGGGGGGMGSGAKIGLGVGIPIAILLIGAAIFFIYRRNRKRIHGSGVDPSEKMIAPSDKQGSILMANQEHDPSSSGTYAGSMAGASPVNPSPQSQIPVVGGVSHRDIEDDRPVSPVQPEDLVDVEPNQGIAAGPSTVRAGGNLEEDREMQWILEEERKQQERREAQQRLPTQR